VVGKHEQGPQPKEPSTGFGTLIEEMMGLQPLQGREAGHAACLDTSLTVRGYEVEGNRRVGRETRMMSAIARQITNEILSCGFNG
jgi:hypothetical protein